MPNHQVQHAVHVNKSVRVTTEWQHPTKTYKLHDGMNQNAENLSA